MNQAEIKELLLECNRQVDIITSTINSIKSINWDNDNIEKFCEEKQISFNSSYLAQPDIQQAIDKIKTYSFDDLERVLTNYKTKNDNLVNELSSWEYYNQQYRTYVESQTKNFIQQLSKHFNITQNINLRAYFNNISTGFQIINNSINSSIDQLYEHFKYGNKNYVIFGKNGAGKTTLLNKIANGVLSENSLVIPANRSLQIGEDNESFCIQPTKSLKDVLKGAGALHNLVMQICSYTLNEVINKNNISGSLIKRLESVFNKLDLERKLLIENNYIYFYIDVPNGKYTLPKCSDGEKAIVFIIMAILLAPQNAFIFIDEPELHLNGALMQKLFNELENERPDIKFIYVTHIINFVESRKNVELIYLEKTRKHNEWKFRNIKDFETADIDMILGIEGTQEDIIFCEGNNQTSIDHRILDCIYDDCFIKPVGSCELAINNTKLLHSTGKYSFLRRKAYSIIDNDFRTEQEIQKLSEDNIKVLEYNEWENLLLCEEVISYVNDRTSNRNIEEIKSNIVELIKNRRTATMNDFINKKYKKIIEINKLSYENIDKKLKETNAQNNEKLKQSLSEYETLFDTYVTENNYESLIKVVPAKCIFKESSKLLGFSDSNAYIDRIVVLLKQDRTFKDLVKSKINLIRN